MTLDDLKSLGLIYLATNYTKHPRGPNIAFIEAKQLVGDLAKQGVWQVFSPIVYGHTIAPYACFAPFDHKLWTQYNLPWIAKCDALLVGTLEGWERSEGIADEIPKFHDRPRFYINPRTLEISNA